MARRSRAVFMNFAGVVVGCGRPRPLLVDGPGVFPWERRVCPHVFLLSPLAVELPLRHVPHGHTERVPQQSYCLRGSTCHKHPGLVHGCLRLFAAPVQGEVGAVLRRAGHAGAPRHCAGHPAVPRVVPGARFNNLVALGIAYAAFNMALAILLVRNFFDNIPLALDDAASLDGCTRFQTFWYVLRPLVTPAVAAASVFVFINAWQDYLLASSLITNSARFTVTVGLYAFEGAFTTNWGAYWRRPCSCPYHRS